MGLKAAVDERVYAKNIWFQNGGNYRILGVVKDMVMNSPYDPSAPTIFFLQPESMMNWIFVKMKSSVGKASQCHVDQNGKRYLNN